MKNLVVIFGGKSTEHDISILTACQVMSAIDSKKYNINPIYIDNKGEWYGGDELKNVTFYKKFNTKKLKSVAILPCSDFLWQKGLGGYKKLCKIDCAIVSCHGKNGEDGTVQGLLELANIPYTSSGVLGSCVGLDKIAMKKLFSSENLPICPFIAVNKSQFKSVEDLLLQIDLPVIVKPSRLGSSIGISVAKTIDELKEAVDLAFMFDENIIVEKLVENLKEINISVLGDGVNAVCSVTEEPQNRGEFLSFSSKYLSGAKNENNGMQNISRIMPANIDNQTIRNIENLAKKIFALLDCKGVVRIDFMQNTQTNELFVNEINTIPGSFAFYLWEKTGLSFEKLIDRLIEIAINSNQSQNKLTSSFSSCVLSNNGGVKK